jgi:hypothetical protein
VILCTDRVFGNDRAVYAKIASARQWRAANRTFAPVHSINRRFASSARNRGLIRFPEKPQYRLPQPLERLPSVECCRRRQLKKLVQLAAVNDAQP